MTYTERLMRDCTLCPRRCHVNRLQGQRGACGMTAELRIARAALHPWEEPCISGEQGSGTVFFSGCPLQCVYCQNHEIAAGRLGKPCTTEQLAETFLDLQAQPQHQSGDPHPYDAPDPGRFAACKRKGTAHSHRIQHRGL